MYRLTTASIVALVALVATSALACQVHKHTVPQPPVVEIPQAPIEGEEEDAVDQGPIYLSTAMRVQSDVELAANPAHFGQFKGRTDLLLRRDYGINRNTCDGYIARRPAMVVDAPNGYEHLKITAHGDVDVLFVEFSNREYLCTIRRPGGQDPAIETRNWPKGPYRIYVGHREQLKEIDYSLTFENLSKPITVDWLDASLPTITIDSDMSKPSFVPVNLAGEPNADRDAQHGDHSCASHSGPMKYLLTPDVRLDVRQQAVVTLGIRANAPAMMTLIGPVPSDRRNIPVQCLPSWNESLDLAPGTYFVRVGVDPDKAPSTLNFFAHGAAAGLDPLATFPNVPEGRPVAERMLTLHYPFLKTNDLLTDDRIRQQLFVNAPSSLYVVARENLGSNSPATVFLGSPVPGDHILDDGRAFEFPVKDELLLMLNEENLVLAADGSLFVIDSKHLKPAQQADAIALPPAARNSQSYFRHAMTLAGTDDQGRIEQHAQRHDRYKQCADGIMVRIQPQIETLNKDAAANRDQIERITTEAEQRAQRNCGLVRLEEEDRRMWRQLEDSRTRRRTDALQQVRARLADLVLVK
ncbi:MAG: hypothetical protein H0U74_02225 [Bradymonadaceae bacterium]|nr:hypothetical protein [Lujinxingiaceae bacterium]